MTGELIRQEPAQVITQQNEILLSMAGMIKAACEKIDRLENQIKRLEKVTLEQTRHLNDLIREHAAELAQEYGLSGAEEERIRAMIRADIKKRYGVLVRDLCRMDAGVCEDFVRLWEDTPRLMRLRRQ